MNYYELIYLIKELNIKFLDEKVQRIISPQKNILECYIGNGCIRFHAVPPSPFIYARSWQAGKKKNVVEFFPELYGKKFIAATITQRDRYLGVQFEEGYWLWFEVFGSKTNTYLVKDERFIGSFKKDILLQNETRNRWLRAQLTQSTHSPELDHGTEEAIRNVKEAKDAIINWNPNFERSHLKELLALQIPFPIAKIDLHDAYTSWESTLAMKAKFQVLMDGSRTLIPAELIGKDVKEEFEGLSDLIYVHEIKNIKDHDFKRRRTSYEKQLHKLRRNISTQLLQLQKAMSNERKADQWEVFGHLIMTLAHKGYPDKNNVSMDNYFDENKRVEIEVQPEKTYSENASSYYERAQKARETRREVEVHIPALVQKKEQVEQAISALEEVLDHKSLDDWATRFQDLGLEWNRPRGKQGGGSPKKERVSRPFFEFKVMGYDVWIGKHARSNDELLSMANKDDIWLHAKGVSGSHVLIRSQKHQPNKSIIEIVASFAAHQSKAKGSAWVPVIYTPKKYVRKAKNAPPGAVIVQKEQVVMVEPEAPKNLSY